jgi:predicted house-cleaning NTP pyrophosphatase (Maf/HAM1 superfamily)
MGIDFEVVHHPISEGVNAGENPLEYVVRMSKERA